MNRRAIKKVIRQLRGEVAMPMGVDHFDMDGWIFPAYMSAGADYACGTAACIAGLAALNEGAPATAGPVEVHGKAILALGLRDEAAAYNVFQAHAWPWVFRRDYNRAKTERGRKLAAARRLEHFLATNGAE